MATRRTMKEVPVATDSAMPVGKDVRCGF
jgi:hypothetical protein